MRVDSSTWTGRGPAYKSVTLADMFPRLAERIRMLRQYHRFVVTVESRAAQNPENSDV